MNQHIAQLSVAQRELMRCAVQTLHDEAVTWFRMMSPGVYVRDRPGEHIHGDPWWVQGQILLHLLFVVHDCVHRAMEPIDSDQLPDDWTDVLSRVAANPVFGITPQFLDEFAGTRWKRRPPENLLEKKRALRDVHDGLEKLLGRAFPSLLGPPPSPGFLRDDCAVFETSRELDHVTSHLENDLLTNNEPD